MRLLVALAVTVMVMVGAPEALACAPIRFEGTAPYEGGDLATQLVRQADNIQIVRVTGFDRPPKRPRFDYWDEAGPALFELTTVETLIAYSPKAAPAALSVWAYQPRPDRVFPPDQPFDEVRGWGWSHVRGWLNPGAMTDALLLSTPDPVGPAPCSARHELEIGDLYIAMSNRDGELYQTQGRALGFPLEPETFRVFDVEGRDWAAPTLIRIADLDDPLVARLRQAVEEERAYRAEKRRQENWDRFYRFIFGRR